MTLKTQFLKERFEFANLGELRDWMNTFKTTDLHAICPADSGLFVLHWEHETLSDDSVVFNVKLTTTEPFTD